MATATLKKRVVNPGRRANGSGSRARKRIRKAWGSSASDFLSGAGKKEIGRVSRELRKDSQIIDAIGRKKNPFTGKITLANVKKELAGVGIRVKKTEYGEIRVGNNEKEAYYSDNLDDALHTGFEMANIKRKRKKNMARKAPTAKQLAARKRFAAMAKAGVWKKRRKGRSKNIAQGYHDATGFHPIRASHDYDPDRLFDSEHEGRAVRGRGRPKATKKKARKASKRKDTGSNASRVIAASKALASRRKNSGRKRTTKGRKRNVSNIIVVSGGTMRRKRKTNGRKVIARSYSKRRVYRRRRNTGYATKRRYSRRRYSRRRNPGFGSSQSAIMKAIGIFGGAALTKIIFDMLPSSMRSGFMKYVSIAGITFVGSNLVGRVLGRGIGSSVFYGGTAFGVLHVATDFLPGFAGLSPFGLKGSVVNQGFYAPQVPVQGTSFNQWVTPNPQSITALLPSPSGNGMGALKMPAVRTGVRY